jgi:hypothetical protein
MIFPLPLRGRQWKSVSTYESESDNNKLNQQTECLNGCIETIAFQSLFFVALRHLSVKQQN